MARALSALKEEITEFLHMTSLHGVKYIATRNNLHERILWVVVCGAAILGTLLMAGTIWTAFQTSPTQTIVQDSSFPIWNVDFPALTVCNLNKVQLSRAKKHMYRILGKETVDNATEQIYLDSLLALGMMRYPFYHHPLIFIREGRKQLMNFDGYNITDIMFKVMAKQNEMFGTCYWKGREIPCNVAFRLQITEEGFCYSFNSKTSQLPNPPDIDSPPFQGPGGVKQPWRNNAAGKTTGLEIFFKSSEDEYLPSDQRTPGYNLIVHHPDEFPDVSRSLFLPRTSQRVSLLAVTASRVHASPALNRLSLSERGCRLRGDSHGTEVLEEVQANCWAQCRITAIVQRCKCVPYFGVHRVSANVSQCTIKDISCLAAYNVLFGGMAGLFLGFSLISAMEILYYMCRATCRVLSSLTCQDNIQRSQTLDIKMATLTTLEHSIYDGHVRVDDRAGPPVQLKKAWHPITYYP